jgi:hypothetical protein
MGFGKFGYMAPEQLIRGGVVDHRTDIYAAGVVLYELLTGQRLYDPGPEPDYRALAKKVAKGEHDLPSKVDRALAPYDDLVATALRPKPEDRYQSAAELRDAIQQSLVGVNPTISTDQLGAFMRELFADEMTAQRELHDRVAKAHLEDFQEQLTSSHTSTVSFAMSLPLPPEVPAAAPKRVTRARPPTAPTDILPQQPPQPPPLPTAVVPTTELGLADGTGSVLPTVLDADPVVPRKKPVAFLIAAGIVVAGGLVFAFARTAGDDDTAAQVAAKPAQPVQTIKVEEIPPEEQSPPSQATQPQVTAPQQPAVEKVEPPPAPPVVEKVQPPAHVVSRVRHHEPTRTPGKGSAATPPKTELTREAVIAKFRAVRHQYEQFKQQNGGRLDADWNDLASFIQYHPNDLEEFSRRIDAFRSRMK